MKKKKWAVSQDHPIGRISEFIKKYIKLNPDERLVSRGFNFGIFIELVLNFSNLVLQFLYINQTFAPAPDQTVKNLYDCYGTDGKLIIHYCKSQAWGWTDRLIKEEKRSTTVSFPKTKRRILSLILLYSYLYNVCIYVFFEKAKRVIRFLFFTVPKYAFNWVYTSIQKNVPYIVKRINIKRRNVYTNVIRFSRKFLWVSWKISISMKMLDFFT